MDLFKKRKGLFAKQKEDPEFLAGQTRTKHALLKNLSHTVKEAQLLFTRAEGGVVGDCRPVQRLCARFEDVLRHGLKASWFGISNKPPSFWPVVVHISRKEAMDYISHLQYAQSDSGKCRAWIRMATNESSLESYIAVLCHDSQLLNQYYETYSFLQDEEMVMALKQLLTGLTQIAFKITVDTASLEFAPAPEALQPPLRVVAPKPVTKGTASEQPSSASTPLASSSESWFSSSSESLLAGSSSGPATSLPTIDARVAPLPAPSTPVPPKEEPKDDDSDDWDILDQPGIVEFEVNEQKWQETRDEKDVSDEEMKEDEVIKEEQGEIDSRSSDGSEQLQDKEDKEEEEQMELAEAVVSEQPALSLGLEDVIETPTQLEAVTEQGVPEPEPTNTPHSYQEKNISSETTTHKDYDMSLQKGEGTPTECSNNEILHDRVSIPALADDPSQPQDDSNNYMHSASMKSSHESPHSSPDGSQHSTSPGSSQHTASPDLQNSVIPLRIEMTEEPSFPTSNLNRFEDLSPAGANMPLETSSPPPVGTNPFDQRTFSSPTTTNNPFDGPDFSSLAPTNNPFDLPSSSPPQEISLFDEPKSPTPAAFMSSVTRNPFSNDDNEIPEIVDFPEDDQDKFSFRRNSTISYALTSEDLAALELEEDHFAREINPEDLKRRIRQLKSHLRRDSSDLRLQQKLVNWQVALLDIEEASHLKGNEEVCGHQLVPLRKLFRSWHCETCSRPLLGFLVTAVRCQNCGYVSHKRCLQYVTRQCVYHSLKDQAKYSLEICPEQGLTQQQFRCARCNRAFHQQPTEARLCDYTGHFYCSECHQNDLAVIPARVLHNWDFAARRVCSSCSQLLTALQRRPLITIQSVNYSLYSVVHDISEIEALRSEIIVMKGYLVECQRAREEHLVQELDPWPHFKDSPHLFSLSDLMEVHKGKLLSQLNAVHEIFYSHIQRECEICSSRGQICMACNTGYALFPFEKEILSCPKCSTLFHRNCFSATKPCPSCQKSGRRSRRSHELAQI